LELITKFTGLSAENRWLGWAGLCQQAPAPLVRHHNLGGLDFDKKEAEGLFGLAIERLAEPREPRKLIRQATT
jgi:hypothetical protein